MQWRKPLSFANIFIIFTSRALTQGERPLPSRIHLTPEPSMAPFRPLPRGPGRPHPAPKATPTPPHQPHTVTLDPCLQLEKFQPHQDAALITNCSRVHYWISYHNWIKNVAPHKLYTSDFFCTLHHHVSYVSLTSYDDLQIVEVAISVSSVISHASIDLLILAAILFVFIFLNSHQPMANARAAKLLK